MYDISSPLIAVILFASLALAIEGGHRIGRKFEPRAGERPKEHINTIQASLLGVLALLLGFTFSLSLQRYDSRSAAVVEEANAIGTAYLRAELLPSSIRDDVRGLLRDYLDLRIQMGAVTLVNEADRETLLVKANQQLGVLWSLAGRAVEEVPHPVKTGLFVQALNEMIDAFGKRDAVLNRHVPEVVLFLLYGTFLMTGVIVGYASGVAGHRASFVAYIMVALIVVLVFIIIDLDRPRRGLIQVSQKSLTDLQASIEESHGSDSMHPTVDRSSSAAGKVSP